MVESIKEKFKTNGQKARAFFWDTPRGRWMIAGLAFLLIAGAAYRVPYMEQRNALLLQTNRSDFDDYFQAARQMESNKSPYGTDEIKEVQKEGYELKDLLDPGKLRELAGRIRGVGTYLYPPFIASLLTPLVELGYRGAAFVFQTFSLLALAGYLFLFRRELSVPREAYEKSVVIGLVLIFQFLQQNASNGNIGFFIILISGVGLLYAFRLKAWLSFFGGFLMGVSGAMKITPGFLGLVLLAGRRWVALAGMVAGVLFTLLFPALIVGVSFNAELLQDWKSLILDTYSKNAIVRAWENNQSVSGMVGKLFLPGSDMKQPSVGLPLIARGLVSPDYIQATGLAVRLINMMLLGVSLAVALAVALAGSISPGRQRHFRDEKQVLRDRSFIAILLLAVLVSLLASGVSWYHAYSLLLLPIMHYGVSVFAGMQKRDGSQKSAVERADLVVMGAMAFFGLFFSFLSQNIQKVLSMYSVMVPVMVLIALYAGFVAVKHSWVRGDPSTVGEDGTGGI